MHTCDVVRRSMHTACMSYKYAFIKFSARTFLLSSNNYLVLFCIYSVSLCLPRKRHW